MLELYEFKKQKEKLLLRKMKNKKILESNIDILTLILYFHQKGKKIHIIASNENDKKFFNHKYLMNIRKTQYSYLEISKSLFMLGEEKKIGEIDILLGTIEDYIEINNYMESAFLNNNLFEDSILIFISQEEYVKKLLYSNAKELFQISDIIEKHEKTFFCKNKYKFTEEKQELSTINNALNIFNSRNINSKSLFLKNNRMKNIFNEFSKIHENYYTINIFFKNRIMNLKNKDKHEFISILLNNTDNYMEKIFNIDRIDDITKEHLREINNKLISFGISDRVAVTSRDELIRSLEEIIRNFLVNKINYMKTNFYATEEILLNLLNRSFNDIYDAYLNNSIEKYEKILVDYKYFNNHEAYLLWCSRSYDIFLESLYINIFTEIALYSY